MRVIRADTYWDGGTVFLEIEDQGVVTRLELDYMVPWDGRPRNVTITDGGTTRVLPVGSKEERDACLTVRRLLEQEYGEISVRESLEHQRAREVAWKSHLAKPHSPFVSQERYSDPHPLPFRGLWLTVYDFVEKAHREGKI